MILRFLLLAMLALPTAGLADEGIPPDTAFKIPYVVGESRVPTRALVTVDATGAATLRVFYFADGEILEAQYTIARKGDPGPDPDPDPTPGPLHVLLVYESDDLDTMPPGQADALTSRTVRSYLAAKCAADGGQPAFRFLDKDVDVSRLPQDWRDVFARANGQPTPWLIVHNGRDAYEGPLPATLADTLALLKKYGG